MRKQEFSGLEILIIEGKLGHLQKEGNIGEACLEAKIKSLVWETLNSSCWEQIQVEGS